MYRIASLDLDEETDIDWKSLNDSSWMWSSHSLQQRWRRLKAPIDTDGMSHRGEYMTYVLHAFCTLISPYISHRRHQCPRGTDETDHHSKQFCTIARADADERSQRACKQIGQYNGTGGGPYRGSESGEEV